MKRSLVAVLATLALTLAACGGGDSGLGKEELIAKGDAICEAGQKAFDQKAAVAFQSNPSPAELIKFVKDVAVPTYRQEVAKLKALQPDGDSASDWNEIVTKLSLGVKTIERHPAAVLKSGSNPLGEASQAARDFGMKVCGSED